MADYISLEQQKIYGYVIHIDMEKTLTDIWMCQPLKWKKLL